MEKNNFNKAYIYIIAFFSIGIAISNIISFFNGVGFALIGASLLLVLAITNILKDDTHKKRFGDIVIFITLEVLMLIVLFFAYDFNINGMANKFPLIMRNICAIYSIFALAYVLFRYVGELKGKTYKFVEYLLGNYVPEPRAKKEKKVKTKRSKAEIKKNKELENGTLEPKPSSLENTTAPTKDTEEVVTSEQVNEDEEVNSQEEVNQTETNEQPAQPSIASENNSNDRPNYWY